MSVGVSVGNIGSGEGVSVYVGVNKSAVAVTVGVIVSVGVVVAVGVVVGVGVIEGLSSGGNKYTDP